MPSVLYAGCARFVCSVGAANSQVQFGHPSFAVFFNNKAGRVRPKSLVWIRFRAMCVWDVQYQIGVKSSRFKSSVSPETDHNGCISKLELIAAVQRDATVLSSVCDHRSVMLAMLIGVHALPV